MAAVLLLTLSSPAEAAIDTQYIFRVDASKCRRPPEVRIQTGFRIRGVRGIVTALHGVVGCDVIGAIAGNEKFPNMRISSVDVDRDVAVLTAPAILDDRGLEPALAEVSKGAVHVWGYPQGISLIEIPLVVPSRAKRALGEMVPPRLWLALQRRGSPEPSIDVISVNGDLQPGHSGAPLFDNEDHVVGVGSGGLGDGTLGIGWAIPWMDIEWTPESQLRPRLAELAASDPRAAFCYSVQQQPCSHPWQWHLRAATFGSVDKRSTTSLFGSNQALGGVVAIGFVLGDDVDLTFEGSSPLKSSLDSLQSDFSAERRYLHDSFFSVTVGRLVRLGQRAQLVPLVGGGLALLQTHRFTYTVERAAVQTLRQDTSRVMPSVTAGVDLRFAVSRRLWIIANHRIHVLTGSMEAAPPRERLQQRIGFGVQLSP